MGFIAIFATFLFLFPVPAFAVQNDRINLTWELLQERVKSPVLREGNLTVNLRGMVIDLRPENAVFRDAFYQLLRKELQKTGAKALGLDLSASIIEGDFLGSELGLRTPLYAQGIAQIFTPTERDQLESLRSVCLQSLAMAFPDSKDCKSLLGNQSTTSSNIAVFRGALIMVESRFNGEVKFPNTFFLQSVNAQGTNFFKSTNWQESRFGRTVSFNNAIFHGSSSFQGSIFFDKANFQEVTFIEAANFQGDVFCKIAKFNQGKFRQVVKFNSSYWQDNADFSNAVFTNQVNFNKVNFHQFVWMKDAIFKQVLIFRESEFNQSVDLLGASILNQADFSDAKFAETAFLNVPGLVFNSNQAKILGNVGEIGKKFIVPTLHGNQNILRNLSQNFRLQQQVGDANQLEYTKQRLKLIELSHRLVAININTASVNRLINLGFSETQASEINQRRQIKHFRNISELLALADVDLETYNKLSDRLIAIEPMVLSGWIVQSLNWLLLSLLLLLSGYGTNFWLVFGVGGVVISCFGVLFWLVDRYRRLCPVPIVPKYYETVCTLFSFTCLMSGSLLAIFRNSVSPWVTLLCLFMIIFPIPGILLWRLYQQGRYHDLMDRSYFTEDGTLRQLRLLIGRLPVIPRNPSFRERYMPLLWDRRWNWLNYYDFSLNNLVRLGFNDIRLRDEHLPGIISALAWYQWSLGLLYIVLAGWTLSRTIPGLNLLIYLK
ncbi:pentapeptide repeat-containing protein [Anabaena sp. UHCC 0253]|uniref:pentapeptide repeat-containing protein n=1 Tax=Anabaena sp. UHCC 0253 TaxID=2590019 RepID=UPI001444B6E7|nr:pentapeptide repeat-containing protein [Anabaena sp. UHCC 0253]MTJ51983.1 pentapeptide repeat-containing protein [Anabaena sp. UHCC 0253]